MNIPMVVDASRSFVDYCFDLSDLKAHIKKMRVMLSDRFGWLW
jgi:hypothetical protein